MADEQLARDVADIRVHTAETAIRVRQISRGQRELQKRVGDLERWRYTVAGAWLAAGFGLQFVVSWVLK